MEGQNSYVHKTLDTFKDIKFKIDNVEDRIESLNSALINLEKDKTELVNLMEGISCISQETSALTEEVYASIQNENEYVHDINNIVSNLLSASSSLKDVSSRFIVK
jgi:methyl-accepting chemotaxis protein